MNDEACLRLEAQVRTEAARLGAPDLGDRSLLSEERLEDGTARLVAPRERLLRRLESLERHVLLLHSGIFEQSMDLIRAAASSGGRAGGPTGYPTAAVAVLPVAGGEGTREFNLADLPDLSEPLRRIRALRAQIQEDDDAGP